jgi:hypothetical protein
MLLRCASAILPVSIGSSWVASIPGSRLPWSSSMFKSVPNCSTLNLSHGVAKVSPICFASLMLNYFFSLTVFVS